MKRIQKGSGYIYIIIIMSVIMVLISTTLNRTSKEFDTTIIDNENNNLYYLSVSGIEKMHDIINKNLMKYEKEILMNSLNSITRIEDVFQYQIRLTSNKYNGKFVLIPEKEAFISEYTKKANEYTIKFLKENFEKSNGVYEISYDVILEENILYNITVTATLEDKILILISNAKNVKTNINYKLKCELIFNTDGKRIFLEDYIPRINLNNVGIASEGEIILTESKINGDNKQKTNINSFIDNSVVLSQSEFIINSNFIDLSNYKEPVIIINLNSESGLTLYSSSNEYFKGIIISYGAITINTDLNIEGSIFSKGDININKSVVNIKPDINIIYKINFEDLEVKRRILDYFRATKFNGIYTIKTSGTSLVKALDKSQLKIKIIKTLDFGNYKITNLKGV